MNRFATGIEHPVAVGGFFAQEGTRPQRMKEALLMTSVLRIVRTYWVGAMLKHLGRSSRIETPKILASSSGDKAKVKRPHITVPDDLLNLSNISTSYLTR
jgi:hypothetical protein